MEEAMVVTALEIKTRQPLAGGRDFGSVGHYIQLDGTVHFAVDPAHPLNSCITDIQLAPRDGDGRVHFSADIRILAPEDPRRLINESYLLAEDLELLVGQASRRYELLAATREPVAAGE
jgi:hypothetical protein